MKTGLLSAWFRLFTYQGSWTFERLQGVGMAYCIEPLLRALPEEQRQQALGRAVAYFNTHPFLAGLVVGAVARAETEDVSVRRVTRLRGALKGPLGSIGDRFVWSGVLPLAVAAGLTIGSTGMVIVAAGVYFVVFNAAHVVLRTWGLRQGWKLGTGVSAALNQPWLQQGADRLRPLAMLALGLAIPVYTGALTGDLGGSGAPIALTVGAVTVVVSSWIAPTLGAARLGVIAIGVGLMAGLV